MGKDDQAYSNEIWEKLNNLKYHEVMKVDDYCNVMRVAKGWIYIIWSDRDAITSCFVPK